MIDIGAGEPGTESRRRCLWQVLMFYLGRFFFFFLWEFMIPDGERPTQHGVVSMANIIAEYGYDGPGTTRRIIRLGKYYCWANAPRIATVDVAVRFCTPSLP